MIYYKMRRALFTALAMVICTGLLLTGTSIASAGSLPTVPGVTARQITIGATVPLTGIASNGYGDVGKAANAVFKYINSKGGINGRNIRFLLKDDCYDACTNVPSTVAQTHSLLALPIFATVGSLGTPTQDSVRSLLRRGR